MTFAPDDIVLWVFAGGIAPRTPTDRPGDWLAFLKVTATGKLEGEYRFRWHNGPGFDSKDEKSFYRLGPMADSPAERQNIVEALRMAMRGMNLTDAWEAEVNGDVFKLHEILQKSPLKVKSTSMFGGKDPLGGRA